MDEITFDDLLTHYQNMLQEISEQALNIKGSLKQALEAVENGWSGLAANACIEKISLYIEQVTDVESELSEAMQSLSGVASAYAESEALQG